MTHKKPSTYKVILKGYLMTNIPTIAIILMVWLGLWKILELNYLFSVFTGTVAGWFYWAVSIKKWIRWVKLSGMDDEQILKIGRLSLLLWNKSTVDQALGKEDE